MSDSNSTPPDREAMEAPACGDDASGDEAVLVWNGLLAKATRRISEDQPRSIESERGTVAGC